MASFDILNNTAHLGQSTSTALFHHTSSAEQSESPQAEHDNDVNMLDASFPSHSASRNNTIGRGVSSMKVSKWERGVSASLRRRMVEKLVNAVFPFRQKRHANDARMREIVQNARQIEHQLFRKAKSFANYVKLIETKATVLRKQFTDKATARERASSSASTALTALHTMRDCSTSGSAVEEEAHLGRGGGKGWHSELSMDIRQIYTQMLLKGIAEDGDEEKRERAAAQEREAFSSANTREEYYALLARRLSDAEKDPESCARLLRELLLH